MGKVALVVDDSYTMRNMVSLTLEGVGFEVISASDGEEAMTVANESETEFDLIVTDINMPNMNGIELITNLRKIKKFKFIPILVLTTEGGDDMKQKGKESGASGWIVKPFSPEALTSAVSRVCV